MNTKERDKYVMYIGRKTNGGVSGVDQGRGPALMSADTLVGNDVYNQNDDDLGDIKEIMLDIRSGRIAYAVLSFGGFLGMGEKRIAVPWDALKLDTVQNRFVLNVAKARL